MSVRKLEKLSRSIWALAQPQFPSPNSPAGWTGTWAMVAATDGDGAEGRLVSMHRFSQSWPSWEMHPAG
jgi:hypothetical protein